MCDVCVRRERERVCGVCVCVCVCGVCVCVCVCVCGVCVCRQNIDPRGHRKWRLSGFLIFSPCNDQAKDLQKPV